MTAINRKLYLSQFVINVVSIVCILIISIVLTPPNFEQRYLSSYVLARTLSLYTSYIIPIILTGFVITFSLLIAQEDLAVLKKRSFPRLIRPALYYTIVIILLYCVFVLFLVPWLQQQVILAETRSNFINRSIDRAQQYIDSFEYERAEMHIMGILNIIPQHEAGNRLFQELQEYIPENTPQIIEAEEQESFPIGLSFEEITARAEELFSEEDYFTAVFYADLALGTRGERNDPAAERILRESLNIIEQTNRSRAELNALELFYLKRLGREAYSNGEIINAYYIFQDIVSQYPRDRDALNSLSEIIPRISDIRFFSDEIENIGEEDAHEYIFIRLPNEGLGSTVTRKFLAAERIIYSTSGLYLMNVEYLETVQGINGDNSVTMHVRIPQAKLVETFLISRVIDREERIELFRPQYIVGQGRENDIFDLGLNEDDLWSLSSGSGGASASTLGVGMDFISLLRFFRDFPNTGLNTNYTELEIVYRVLFPLSLFAVSFFVLSLAWQWRSRHTQLPVGIVILLPLVPLTVFGFFELYRFVYRSILASLVILGDITFSFIIMSLLQVVLFLLSLLLMSRQKI